MDLPRLVPLTLQLVLCLYSICIIVERRRLFCHKIPLHHISHQPGLKSLLFSGRSDLSHPGPSPPKEKIHWWPVQQIHGARGPRLHWLSATRHAELMPGDHCCRSLQSPSPLPVLFCLVLCCRSVRGQKSEILSYRSERSSTSIDQRPEDKRTWNGLGWRTRRSHETVDTDRHAIDHLSGQRVYHHHRLTHG